MTNPIFCAVDRPDLEGTLALARALAPHVGGIKLGLEFFAAQGPRGVEAVAALGLPIFLDLKLHDIPNTVAGAVRAGGEAGRGHADPACGGGPGHAGGGGAAAARRRSRPWLLGVTVLTSLTMRDLAAIGCRRTGRAGAAAGAAGAGGRARRARLLAAWRSRALRASARARRPSSSCRASGPARRGDDQKRTMGPAEALALGADILVIGRPITRAAVAGRGRGAIAPGCGPAA